LRFAVSERRYDPAQGHAMLFGQYRTTATLAQHAVPLDAAVESVKPAISIT
jgi:hypothetical protein